MPIMAGGQNRQLDEPLVGGRRRLVLNADSFGQFSESIARLLGTGRFLFWQSIVVGVWIAINIIAGKQGLWDKYPFVLLNLVFSTQAAYAAPLILLAQNRQDDRDRSSLRDDRQRAEQTKVDTESLVKEIAALRKAVDDLVSRQHLHDEIENFRVNAARR